MAYISPNSDVHILKGVSLDSDYNHTLFCANATAQYNALYTYKKYTLNNQSYQRAGRNKIRVALLADDLYDCNYLMFRNTSFGNKWFYAFIDAVNYINNNATEIEYTIDDMQTWYFDYELGQCFVEREHALTDVAGDNLVPENLEIGELVANNIVTHQYPRMLAAIVSSKEMKNVVELTSDSAYVVNTQFHGGASGVAPSGVPCGLFIAYGIPLFDDWAYWKNNYTLYNMQDPRLYDVTGTTPYSPTAPGVSLSLILWAIGTGALDFGITMNDIVDVYLYPAELNLKTAMNASFLNGNRDGTAEYTISSIYRPTTFKSSPSDSTPYTPKNKKLLTYPYIQLMVTNNNGNTADFRYENFSTPTIPEFKIAGNFTINPTINCLPISHKGISSDYDSSLTLSNFPKPAYSGNQFISWLESNRNQLTMSYIATGISGISSVFNNLSRIGSNPIGSGLGMANAGVSSLTSIQQIEAKISDLRNAPPQVQGQMNCDTFNTGFDRTGFRFIQLNIKKEFAKIVDDYFTMFGYAIHQVKTPNVRSGLTLRPHWNYIKTNGCIIHASSGSGLPSDAESKIAKIYDRGITFWNDLSEVGNYSLNNAI